MNFPSHIFFNDVNHGYRASYIEEKFFVAASVLYEKVRRTMHTAVVLYPLMKNHEHFFSLKNNNFLSKF